METAVKFEDIVRAWLLEYDDRLPNNRNERREALIILLGNLRDHGYIKDDLNTSRKQKIVSSAVNPYHDDKKKLKRWISMVVNDLEAATLIYYGTIKIRKDVLTDEMKAKLYAVEQKAEEQKALRSPKTDSDATEDTDELDIENHGDELDISQDPVDLDVEVRSAVAPKETFKITDELFLDTAGPDILWDEDFAKKLGIE